MGTYSDDRQPTLDALLVEPARRWAGGRFVVAGPMYPPELRWPPNVRRITHLPPAEHRGFYNAQRFTLNVTRADMIAAGWSPSVRLFEAAACGTPIVSDWWAGLDTLLAPGTEVLVARDAAEALAIVREMPEAERRAIGDAARRRVLASHTAAHRAAELEAYVSELLAGRSAV
jgi:spore maturation protein CgeB